MRPIPCMLWAVCVPAVTSHAQVASFARLTDTIRVVGDTVTPSALTIEARVFIPNPNTPVGRIFGEQTPTGPRGEDKMLQAGATDLFGGAWTGPNYGNFWPGPRYGPLPIARWVHVAFVRDGAGERLYLDGTLVGSEVWTEPIGNTSGSDMAIGAFQNRSYYSSSFLGLMDWVRVSNVARYIGAGGPVPECEPAPDAQTQLLFLFNEPPGSTTVTDSGPGRFVGTFGVGFTNATSPQIVCPTPALTAHPDPVVTCPGETVLFRADASFACAGTPAFRWRRGGVPLSDGPTGTGSTISGAATPELRIDGVSPADTGDYDCSVSNACGAEDTADATLTIVDCSPDCDCASAPGTLDIFDFLCFQNRYAALDPYACDCDTSSGPGVCDIFDFLCFQNAFAAGCR